MDPRVNLSIIAAVAENNVIGFQGEIPWRLKDDLQRFKRLTLGHTVIAGRLTYESIVRRLGRPLKDRAMIVLTNHRSYSAPGCIVVHSWAEALERMQGAGEVFAIGGERVYRMAMPMASRMYLTKVAQTFEGDAFFVPFNEDEWDIKLWADVDEDEENDHYSTFTLYERPSVVREVGPAPHVVLENARGPEQLRVMEAIQKERVCPFCPGHHLTCELNPPLRVGEHWSVHVNRWPYGNTNLHLLLLHRAHAERLADVQAEAWLEFTALLQWIETVHKVPSGAVCMRFGNPAGNGATVNHLHAHLIVAKTDVDRPDYEDVKFRVGPKKAIVP